MMTDTQYYELQNKLARAEHALKLIRPRLNFNWHEIPSLPHEVAKLCETAARAILEIGQTASKELDVDACAKHYDSLGAFGPNPDARQTDQTKVSPSMGCQGPTDQQGPNNSASG